jgi:hypothetical protein
MDYDAARATVEALLRANPQLRAVDLAFVGRNESLTVRRMPDGQLVVMSDDMDCFQKLGSLGCSSAKPSKMRDWYEDGHSLSGGFEGRTNDRAGAVPSFQWLDGPGFMPATSAASGGNSSDASSSPGTKKRGGSLLDWVPAYSLVFRSVFPGTAGALSLLGRVTLDVSGLRENDVLVDNMLGARGAIYICDRFGLLLAAQDPGDTVLVSSPRGQVNFRYIWQLRATWAQGLQRGDFEGAGKNYIWKDGVQVVVAPLRDPGLEHFSVVVAADREPFVDEGLTKTSLTGEVLVGIPYIVCAMSVFVWYGSQCAKRFRQWRKNRRVHPELPQGPMGRSTFRGDHAQRMSLMSSGDAWQGY